MDNSQYELIRRIASVVGHEFRNPLAIMNNSVYFVKTKLESFKEKDAKVQKHLGIISSEIAHADSLISDMLRFSRTLELVKKPVELGAILEEALSKVPEGIKVKKEGAKEAVSLNADFTALAEVFRRLADNAVEAMAGQGTLVVSVQCQGKQAVIEMKDSGSGIKKEVLGDIFNPFFTTKPRGLGLGLAVAKKILDAHQGSIEARNIPAGGASFVVKVPRL